jgi:nicotinamidase-related amidase
MASVLPVPEFEVHERVEVDARRTALVVVDMQNDFVAEEGALHVPTAAGTIPEIQTLLGKARERGMTVVFTQDTHGEQDPEFELWPPHARQGTWGWEIVPELAPQEGETVLRKPRYDAFYGTPLDHLLRVWGVTTLVLCGTVANICVHYTAASAALRWIDIVVVQDAVSALDPFDLAASLRQTAFLFAGKITSAEGVVVR